MMTKPLHTYAVKDHVGNTIRVYARTRREALVRVALATKWQGEREVEMITFWQVRDLGLARDCKESVK